MTSPTNIPRVELVDRSKCCRVCAEIYRDEPTRYAFLVFERERIRIGPISQGFLNQLRQMVAGQIVIDTACNLVHHWSEGGDLNVHRLIAAVGVLPNRPVIPEGGI